MFKRVPSAVEWQVQARRGSARSEEESADPPRPLPEPSLPRGLVEAVRSGSRPWERQRAVRVPIAVATAVGRGTPWEPASRG
jgi:hypothetical protein